MKKIGVQFCYGSNETTSRIYDFFLIQISYLHFSLVKLEKLLLSGEISDDFNFGLLENLSNHLQELSIDLKIDNNQISKLFE